MATNIGRYRKWYSVLLRLYPSAFREQYSEGISQTFHDLCRERAETGRGLFWFALWMFLETSMGIVRENTIHMSQAGKMILRAALVALGLLMVPLVASRLVPGWNWKPTAFVFVYLLFFGTAILYALVAKKMSALSYKVGVGVALFSGFALGWSNMVHVADSHNPANLVYYSVLAVGIVGACLARLKARGLAVTLFAMAATLALIAVILPSGAPPNMARNMAIGHAGLVALFTTSGLMFRHASVARVE
jgi:hypothetical protein